MIDLHTHILPGIDDGSKSVSMSLEMARMAVSDGITQMACTPHITPGVYDNDPAGISARMRAFQAMLDKAGIALQLVAGADVHVVPDLAAQLSDGRLPCIEGTRYFLFEPPHHVAPPGLLRVAQEALDAGFVPVLTHPERLTWIEKGYGLICELDEAGVAVQVTAGALTGDFGERVRNWAFRMLDEGRVDIIASDAHDPKRRPPLLSKARAVIAERAGEQAARLLTLENPRSILANDSLPAKYRASSSEPRSKSRVKNIKKLFGIE